MIFRDIFQNGLSMFDSILATIFFIKFNRYVLKERIFILMLVPFLFVITKLFDNTFDIAAIIISVLLSFMTMRLLKFNRTTKIRQLWSCIQYFGTLVFVNTLIYESFKLFTAQSINSLLQETNCYIEMCLISKCLLLLIVKIYISLEKNSYNNHSNENFFAILFITIYNVMLIMILMTHSINESIIKRNFGFLMIMLGIFFSEIICYYTYIKLNNKSKLELELFVYRQKNAFDKQLFEEKKLQNEHINRINHDIKGHLSYIAHSIENRDYEKALDYLTSINGHSNFPINYFSLKDSVLDFIINQKIVEAKLLGIDVIAQVENIFLNIEEFDLCVLLSNLLNNAIEGSLNSIEKVIKVEAYSHQAYHIITVKNKISFSVLSVNKDLVSTKTNDGNHGYGLRQIHDIVEKYHGYIDIYEADDFFCVNTIIPIKQIE